MNQISFGLRISEGWRVNFGRHQEVVDIFVNGRNLIDITREVEAPFAVRDKQPELAGSYEGLVPELIFFPSRLLLGEAPPPGWTFDTYPEGGKVPVLGCTCTVVECWPLLVRITVNKDTVVWNEFEQPHRNQTWLEEDKRWTYGSLGPFVFDRQRYEAELAAPKP